MEMMENCTKFVADRCREFDDVEDEKPAGFLVFDDLKLLTSSTAIDVWI